MGETTSPHNHYVTHGTINQLQLSAPKYCHSCANSQSGKYSNTTGKYVKLAGRQIRKMAVANTKASSQGEACDSWRTFLETGLGTI